MGRPRVYPDELRTRAVRLVMEWREARGVTDGGYTAVCTQLGLRRETLRRWVIEAEVRTTDGGLVIAEFSVYPLQPAHREKFRPICGGWPLPTRS